MLSFEFLSFSEIGDCALIGVKAHIERALEWQEFYFRVRPRTVERHAARLGG